MKYSAIGIALLSVLSGCAHVTPISGRNTPVAQVQKDSPSEIDIRGFLPQQDPTRYWWLRSQMTTTNVESKFAGGVWLRGMPLGELTSQLGSVPLGTLDTMVFALADGTLTCELNRNFLQSWQIRKDSPQTNQVKEEGSGDPHRNAYCRVARYLMASLS